MSTDAADPVLAALCARLGDAWRASPVTAAPELAHVTQPGSDSHALFQRFEARGLATLRRKPRRWGDLAHWRVSVLGLSLATEYQVRHGA